MTEWKRGRKPLPQEEKEKRKEWQKSRVKIANLVARDKTIEKVCCICGKENAPILHNKENPYKIAFMCKECRLVEGNIEKAKIIDLKEIQKEEIANRKTNVYLNTRKFTKQEVKDLIEGYINPNNTLSIKEYIDNLGISRHQFNKILNLYKEYFPKDAVLAEQSVINRSKAIQRNKLSIAGYLREESKRRDRQRKEELLKAITE